MFKRMFLFLAMNMAIIIVGSIIIAIVERVFWINISSYWWSYLWLFIFSLIFWFLWSFISLYSSKWLAKRAYKIVPITLEQVDSLSKKEKAVWSIVEDLANRNSIKMPEVWIYNSNEPNAFATWASKNSSLVAVSSWLLDSMDIDAIEWVVGHEMAHILNWDMVTMTLLQWVLNTFVIFFSRILANVIDSAISKWERNWPTFTYYIIVIFFEIILWILASTIAMWFSRHREFKADEWSAKFLWKEKMIAALIALKKVQPVLIPVDSKDKMANFKISSKNWRGVLQKLFSSHPPLEDRIKALENSIL